MKQIFSKRMGLVGLILGLTINHLSAFVFEYNIDPRGIDEFGRRLPKKIDISTYQAKLDKNGNVVLDKNGNPVSKYFNDYLKARGNTDTAIDIISKAGPIFGRVTGKIAGAAVEGAVMAETGSRGGGAAAGKATEEMLTLLGSGLSKLVQSSAFSEALYKSEQGWNSDRHGHYLHDIKPGMKKCRDLNSMKKSNREHVNENNPKPVLVAVYNRDPITTTVKGKEVKTQNFQLLSLKWLYPMGPDPQNGKFFTGPLRIAKDNQGNVITNPKTGKPAIDGARGGVFGSYSISTRYQTTPIYVEKTVVDAQGNKKKETVQAKDDRTGEPLFDVRLVADFDLMKLRGGTTCPPTGENEMLEGKPVSNEDFYPVGKLESDTTKETLTNK